MIRNTGFFVAKAQPKAVLVQPSMPLVPRLAYNLLFELFAPFRKEAYRTGIELLKWRISSVLSWFKIKFTTPNS